jgi:predicted HD phosphohydrolase
MTPGEVLEFEAQPHWRNALRVRVWDDKAKIVGWTVPGLEAYAERIRRLAK